VSSTDKIKHADTCCGAAVPPLDLISYTTLLIACWRLWDMGQSFELSKFWDELELLKYKEDNNEKIS
jgi:hypothetical protein